jgi:hypothetical protein
MKTICLIGFLLLSFCLNAQRIKIHVTEALYSYSFDTTLLELLKNDSIEKVVKDVNSLYDLDLTEKTFKFYIGDELSWEDGLTFEKNGEILEIRFLIEGYNIGMIINTNIFNEQVIWYYDDYFKEIYNFTKFEIIKAL